MKSIIDAKDSDIFDVLAFVAFAEPPVSRSERVEQNKGTIYKNYDYKQQEFIEFILKQYVKEGVGELAADKLHALIELHYNSINDAVVELGSPRQIREVFYGFQRYLYGQFSS